MKKHAAAKHCSLDPAELVMHMIGTYLAVSGDVSDALLQAAAV